MKQQPIFSTTAEGALFSSLLGHPFPAYSQQMPENGSLRVAAYIRVSTDSRRQEDSYQRQEEHFTRLFSQHPEWEPVGIYSDYGMSATSQQKRVGFRRLLRHCREGKVQRILCKSISRFARNTRDFMEALSALREGGATIYFETEHLDTAYYTNEFVLTTLAALAQEESRSLSENIRWGIQKQYQIGEAKNLPIYGYRYAEKRDSPGHLAQVEIVEAQAKVVRWVFEQAALGRSFQSIAASLNQADIAPPDTIWSRKHKRLREGAPPKLGERRDEVEIGWTGEQIRRMLQTERYAGDLLLQKKYKVNFYTETLKVNRGELPKYLVESHHPAIVSRELFGQVQQRFQHSRNSGVRRRYPFSQRLVCASCGRYYTIRSHGRTSVWYCPTAALSYGVNACSGETLPEAMLSRMFFQGVLLRFLFSAQTKIPQLEKAMVSPWESIRQVTPRLAAALAHLRQTDQVETQRALLKRQIQAAACAVSCWRKAACAGGSKLESLLNHQKHLETVLRQREAYWEQLEQGYADRQELNSFLQLPLQENIQPEEWCTHLVQPLALSIHVFSGFRFWIHWFDDTFTRLTVTKEGEVLSCDHRCPEIMNGSMEEGAWKV